MGKEIELKLEVPPQELRRLKGWRTLSRKGAGEQDLASVYFDTPKHKLGRNGISLRIRRNGKNVQCRSIAIVVAIVMSQFFVVH